MAAQLTLGIPCRRIRYLLVVVAVTTLLQLGGDVPVGKCKAHQLRPSPGTKGFDSMKAIVFGISNHWYVNERYC